MAPMVGGCFLPVGLSPENVLTDSNMLQIRFQYGILIPDSSTFDIARHGSWSGELVTGPFADYYNLHSAWNIPEPAALSKVFHNHTNEERMRRILALSPAERSCKVLLSEDSLRPSRLWS
ncbi:hypothetical protein ACOSQ4_014058 [Xanthoceras sorbifolium]